MGKKVIRSSSQQSMPKRPFTLAPCLSLTDEPLQLTLAYWFSIHGCATFRVSVLTLQNWSKQDLFEKVKLKLQVLSKWAKISFTTDGWSSRVARGYLTLTAHFIDINWELQSLILSFDRHYTPHTGEAASLLLFEQLKRWDMLHRVQAFTMDNGPDMVSGIPKLDKLTQHLVNQLDDIPHDSYHARCLAHIVNLGAKDALDAAFMLLRRVREFIKFFGFARRRERWEELCKALAKDLIEGKTDLEFPSIDVTTRWNSTHEMLEKVIKKRELCDQVNQTIEAAFPESEDIKLDHQDWEVAEMLKRLLHTSAKVTTARSGQDYPTASLREPLFGLILSNAEKLSEQMDARVEKMLSSPSDEDGATFAMVMSMKSCLEALVKKLNKYEGSFCKSKTNHLCVALDRRVSLNQTEKRGAKRLLEAELAEQGLVDYNSKEEKASENQVAASILTEALQPRGGSSYNDTLSEVDRFLDERMAPSDDLLQWWKVKQNAYPSLAKLARNYLAISATTVPSVRVCFLMLAMN